MASGDTLAVWDALSGHPPATGYPSLDVRNGHVVLDFDAATDEATDLAGVMPTHYSGSGDVEVVVTWAASTATSGTVVWSAQIERQQPGSSFDLDSDSLSSAVSNNGTAPTAAGRLAQTMIDLSGVSSSLIPAAGESFRLRLSRDADAGSDTMSGDAELVSVELREV